MGITLAGAHHTRNPMVFPLFVKALQRPLTIFGTVEDLSL